MNNIPVIKTNLSTQSKIDCKEQSMIDFFISINKVGLDAVALKTILTDVINVSNAKAYLHCSSTLSIDQYEEINNRIVEYLILFYNSKISKDIPRNTSIIEMLYKVLIEMYGSNSKNAIYIEEIFKLVTKLVKEA
jgi:hypothetical protein